MEYVGSLPSVVLSADPCSKKQLDTVYLRTVSTVEPSRSPVFHRTCLQSRPASRAEASGGRCKRPPCQGRAERFEREYGKRQAHPRRGHPSTTTQRGFARSSLEAGQARTRKRVCVWGVQGIGRREERRRKQTSLFRKRAGPQNRTSFLLFLSFFSSLQSPTVSPNLHSERRSIRLLRGNSADKAPRRRLSPHRIR